MDALPYSGHGEEDGRLHLAEVDLHRLDRFGEVEDRAVVRHRPCREQALGDVAQWQVGELLILDPLTMRCREPLGVVDHLEDRELDIAMGQHRSLRWAGGPRRVDEGHDLIAIDLGHQPFDRSRVGRTVLRTQRHEFVPEHESIVVEVPHTAWLDVDDPVDRREGVASGFEHLVDLFLVLGEVHP